MNVYGKRLLVVSNRLPVVIHKEDDECQIQAGTGGLVTALGPVMEENHGLWIGWPGVEDGSDVRDAFVEFSKNHPYSMEPVWLSPNEVDKYYRGFSNETIWPLFHDLLGHCKFEEDNWHTYMAVNQIFAKTTAELLNPDDFLWVHDYQLMLVGRYLRKLGITHPIAYFLHIPFPSLDLFRRLPWKHKIIRSLMEYDLLGFQTLRDRRNFVQCVKSLIPEVKLTIQKGHSLLKYCDRTIKVGHFPIGIDYDYYNKTAKTQEVADAAWFLHENLGARQLILGLDRLDYTKGIPERFLALECALEKYPELQGTVSLVQILVPSRTHVRDYQTLKEQLDRLIGRINGKFSTHGWAPIHYMYRTLDRVQLIGHYRACEIALVTPLRDGMNLVAKEYCASSVENNGVLILSEFAGAADQLAKGALIVNPYDLEGTADAIYKACTMKREERERRMRFLRTKIRRNNVYRWVDWFLESFNPSKASVNSKKTSRNVKSYDQDYEHREITDMKLWIDQNNNTIKHIFN